MDRMTPPEEHYRYREQIGAFMLGKLDEGERAALQRHLNSCPVCQAEERELEPVVVALSYAAPDRIDENRWPPEDLEESTLAPILGEMRRERRHKGRSRWSELAAAAICVVAIGLAGFTWLLEPAIALVEPVPFSVVGSGMKVEGNLIAHDSGTEINLVVSGLRDGQTHRVTLVSEDGERVNSGTFIGMEDKPFRGTFNAALLRKDTDRLEVRTPDGKLVFFAKLPEEPQVKVRDWPLFGILPWAAPDLQNQTARPSTKDKPAPADAPKEVPKAVDSGIGTPPKGSAPEGGNKGSTPGDEKPAPAPSESASPGSASPESASPGPASPGAAPDKSGPGRGPYGQSPDCDQYSCDQQ